MENLINSNLPVSELLEVIDGMDDLFTGELQAMGKLDKNCDEIHNFDISE